jgi:hypothetical protein
MIVLLGSLLIAAHQFESWQLVQRTNEESLQKIFRAVHEILPAAMQAEQIFLVNNGIKNVDMLANEYLELGKLLGSQQKPEQAIQSFGASIRLRPHHSSKRTQTLE